MNKLVNCFYRRPNAFTRLICFPWAGGGSLFYARWGSLFDESVEVFSIRLPGRESRASDPSAQSMDQIVDEIITGLLPQLQEKRFAFFGHSFGAFISFVTAVRLKEKYGLEPVHLFVSGASTPPVKTVYPSEKSDGEFLEWVTSAGGTPAEILENKEALQLFLPLIKADVKVLNNFLGSYEKPASPPLTCSLTCFDGTEDIPHDLAAWKELTSGDFNIHKMPGGHFYLKDPQNEKSLVTYVSKYIELTEVDYF